MCGQQRLRTSSDLSALRIKLAQALLVGDHFIQMALGPLGLVELNSELGLIQKLGQACCVTD